jgi:ATP-dependent Clp protease ATP-binding subunit ClpB
MADKTLELQNFTNDGKQIVASAQALADEQKHAEVTPLHLLMRLLDRDRGVIELLRKVGADPAETRDLCEIQLRKLPKQTTGVAYVSARLLDLLGRAEREAQRDKADAVGVEHLMHALAQEIRGPAGEILSAQGIGPGAFRPHVAILEQAAKQPERTSSAGAGSKDEF